MKADVFDPKITVPQVTIAFRVSTAQRVLETPRLPTMIEIPRPRIITTSQSLHFCFLVLSRFSRNKVDGASECIAVPRIANTLYDLNFFYIAQRNSCKVNKIPASSARHIQRPAVNGYQYSSRSEAPYLDCLIIEGCSNLLGPLNINTRLSLYCTIQC